MVDGGGVGLLPALCLLRMAWVLLTLLTESCLPPSSGAMAGEELSVTSMQWFTLQCQCTRHKPADTCPLLDFTLATVTCAFRKQLCKADIDKQAH